MMMDLFQSFFSIGWHTTGLRCAVCPPWPMTLERAAMMHEQQDRHATKCIEVVSSHY
jgi:hypothetical protein